MEGNNTEQFLWKNTPSFLQLNSEYVSTKSDTVSLKYANSKNKHQELERYIRWNKQMEDVYKNVRRFYILPGIMSSRRARREEPDWTG